jgi:hypothetical protein
MPPDPNTNLLERERGRFGILLVSILALLVVLPFVPKDGTGGTLIRVSWSAVILAGLLNASRKRKALWIALVIAIPTLALRWAASHYDLPAVKIAEPLSSALFMAFTAGVVLRSIFFEQRVTLDEILGGVIVYLLIGVTCGSLHHALELAHPGAYLLGDVTLTATSSGTYGDLVLTFVYYSFTTLTTLGYGDIRPVIPAARMLSSVEALVGQLYVAILIARLVGSHISQRNES